MHASFLWLYVHVRRWACSNVHAMYDCKPTYYLKMYVSEFYGLIANHWQYTISLSNFTKRITKSIGNIYYQLYIFYKLYNAKLNKSYSWCHFKLHVYISRYIILTNNKWSLASIETSKYIFSTKIWRKEVYKSIYFCYRSRFPILK